MVVSTIMRSPLSDGCQDRSILLPVQLMLSDKMGTMET